VVIYRLNPDVMASSDSLEEKSNGNIEEAGEQDPCMGETSAQVDRQTSVAKRARQYWQQLRRLTACNMFLSFLFLSLM